MDAKPTSVASDAPPLVAPLTITNEQDPTKVRIGSEGGSIAVTNGAGTRFELDVPAGALLSPLEITATPVSFGDNDVRGQGVVYGPAGLSFVVAATLKVTPVTPVPVARQLAFMFTDDGTAITAAEPSVDAKDVVIVATHFSGYGYGDLTDLADKARGGYARWKATNEAARLESEANDLIAVERAAQQSGAGADPDFGKKLAAKMDEYEAKVVQPRLRAPGKSCADAEAAVASALGSQRQRQLFGMPIATPNTPAPQMTEFLQLMVGPCEKEAVKACRAAKDASVLVTFWLGADRSSALFGGPELFPLDGMQERAQTICEPQAYQISGGLQDWKVNAPVCNIMDPFTLSGDIGTMEFSGGLTGTYTFGGVMDSRYTGTYTFTFPNGPKAPGKLVGGGSGSIAGQAGSGTENYTATPIGPAC